MINTRVLTTPPTKYERRTGTNKHKCLTINGIK